MSSAYKPSVTSSCPNARGIGSKLLIAACQAPALRSHKLRQLISARSAGQQHIRRFRPPHACICPSPPLLPAPSQGVSSIASSFLIPEGLVGHPRGFRQLAGGHICLWSQNNLPLIIPIPHQHLLLLRLGFPGPSAVTGSWAGALITAFVLQSELIPHKAHFSQSGVTPRACEWCKLPQWLM